MDTTLDAGPPAAPADLFTEVCGPQYAADPYPYLARLRDQGPALRTEQDVWLVTRHADVVAGLRDPALSCDLSRSPAHEEYFRARGIDARFPMPLNALDPPEHRRIRTAISREFVPQAVDRLRPDLDAVVADVVRGLPDSGVVDLVADLAYPVPIAVVGRLFGIPPEDWPMLERWSRAFGAASDLDLLLGPDQREAATAATAEAGEYFARLVADRRRRPVVDLMGRWLATVRQDRSMTVAELLVNGVFLLMVGHHNTVSLIAGGVLNLLRHPEELARLRADPGLLDNAVDELLRYDSPVQTATRVTTEALDVGGTVIPAGRTTLLLIGAANRDPRAFDDPDRVDVSRAGTRQQVGFGRGLHACLGAYLARIETGQTLRALLARYPEISLAGEPVRPSPSFSLRSLSGLPVGLQS